MGQAQSTSEPFNPAGSMPMPDLDMSDLGSNIRFVMTEVTKLEERVNNIVEDNRSHKKDLRWTWSGGVGAIIILVGMFLYGYNRLDDKISALSNKMDSQNIEMMKLMMALNTKIDTQNIALNTKIDALHIALNAKIDALNMALNAKIDAQNAEIVRSIAVLSVRLDALAERLPPSAVRKH